MQLTFDEATEAFRHEFESWLDANHRAIVARATLAEVAR